MTEFKQGDRVKVTFEGTVAWSGRSQGEPRVSIDTGDGALLRAWAHPWHVEKLPDPEPRWRSGDVIDVGTGPLYRDRGVWRWSLDPDEGSASEVVTDSRVSADWRIGDVAVLFKVDD